MQHLYSKMPYFILNIVSVIPRKEKNWKKIQFSIANFFEWLWAGKISDAWLHLILHYLRFILYKPITVHLKKIPQTLILFYLEILILQTLHVFEIW